MMMITNNFHNTVVRSRKFPSELLKLSLLGPETPAEKVFCRRTRKALCGSADCTCARSPLGERGPQEWDE